MALIDHVYKDAGLTQQFDDAVDTLTAYAINGSSGDGVFYVGTPNAANQIQANSDPGIDPITVSITDTAPGTGVEATHIKLALTQGGLDTAIGGLALNLAATILGGAVNAVPVFYRWDNSTGSGTSTEITIDIVARLESAQ